VFESATLPFAFGTHQQGWDQLHWKVINQITITWPKPSIKLPLPLQGF
jgi:hypothetical protein